MKEVYGPFSGKCRVWNDSEFKEELRGREGWVGGKRRRDREKDRKTETERTQSRKHELETGGYRERMNLLSQR